MRKKTFGFDHRVRTHTVQNIKKNYMDILVRT